MPINKDKNETEKRNKNEPAEWEGMRRRGSTKQETMIAWSPRIRCALCRHSKRNWNVGGKKRAEKNTKQIKLGFIFLLSVQSQQLALNMYTSWFFGELRAWNSNRMSERKKSKRTTRQGWIQQVQCEEVATHNEYIWKKQRTYKNSCSPIFSFPFCWVVRHEVLCFCFYLILFFQSYSSCFSCTC